MYSKTLSEKVKRGISSKKAKGQYEGGRPHKQLNITRLKSISSHFQAKGKGFRQIAFAYNEKLPPRYHVSYSTVKRVLQKK